MRITGFDWVPRGCSSVVEHDVANVVVVGSTPITRSYLFDRLFFGEN